MTTNKDEFDDEFKKKLGYIFGISISNGSDFVKGVQIQLKVDAGFQSEIDDLKQQIKDLFN